MRNSLILSILILFVSSCNDTNNTNNPSDLPINSIEINGTLYQGFTPLTGASTDINSSPDTAVVFYESGFTAPSKNIGIYYGLNTFLSSSTEPISTFFTTGSKTFNNLPQENGIHVTFSSSGLYVSGTDQTGSSFNFISFLHNPPTHSVSYEAVFNCKLLKISDSTIVDAKGHLGGIFLTNQ